MYHAYDIPAYLGGYVMLLIWKIIFLLYALTANAKGCLSRFRIFEVQTLLEKSLGANFNNRVVLNS